MAPFDKREEADAAKRKFDAESDHMWVTGVANMERLDFSHRKSHIK